jgi:dihydrofolate reductase
MIRGKVIERRQIMRIVTYGGAVSLDGFLAGIDGSIDWLQFSKDVGAITTAYWKDVDTILMGRKTYEVAAAQRPAKSANVKSAKRRSHNEAATRTYVFSRTLKSLDEPATELVTGNAVQFVRDLKQRSGKGICLMGGGELAQSLLAAGLVDHIGLNIHPILLGQGIPTFRDLPHRVKLALTECRTIAGGCIFANYKVLLPE